MNSLFQSLTSLNPERRVSLLGYCGAAAAGWAALECMFAVWVFVVPHGPNFGPEIGLEASFMVFSLVYTIGYLALFIIMALPMKLALMRAQGALAKRLLPLVSGAVFALVSGVFEALNSSAQDAYGVAILFALAGVACMVTLQVAAK